jgi:hypothetical protein
MLKHQDKEGIDNMSEKELVDTVADELAGIEKQQAFLTDMLVTVEQLLKNNGKRIAALAQLMTVSKRNKKERI